MDDRQASAISKIAIGFAVAGFFVTIETIARSTGTGFVTHCDYSDYGALPAGGFAAVPGLTAVVAGLARRSSLPLLLGAAAIALGASHVAAGTGAIRAPCG